MKQMSSAELDFDPSIPPDIRLAFASACQGMDGLVQKVVIFSHHRHGEQRYWLAMVFAPGKRYGLGTPDLRPFTLAEQAQSLCQQLRELAVELKNQNLPRTPTDRNAANKADLEAAASKVAPVQLSTEPQQFPKVKCPTCGWVHIAIPAADARKQVTAVNEACIELGRCPGASMTEYMRCVRCRADSVTFVPANNGDAPTLATLQPVVTER